MARILLVEDQAVHAELTGSLLCELGYEVVGIAGSGADALKLADVTHPDLVLMDIRLPGELDGVATAQRLRTTSDIPIVYVTGYADRTTLQRATISGPLGCVIKPFDEAHLYAAIETALHQQKLEQQLRAAEAQYLKRFEENLAGMFLVTLDGTILECNTVFASTMGYQRREELAGQRIADLLVEPAEWVHLAGHLRMIETAHLELCFRRRDGTVKWTLGNAVRVGDGDAARIEGQLFDLTEHRRAEEAARSREALGAVAALARATAHEILNPLTTVLGRLQLMERHGHDAWQHLQITTAIRSTERIREVVQHLMNITQLELNRAQGEHGAMLDIRRSSSGTRSSP